MTESELRDFMREQSLRVERAQRSTEAWLRSVDRRTQEMIRRTDEQIEALRDLRDESRAQRAALLSMIDRLSPGGQPPAPA
ncbi:MAG: hypothetical protein H0V25_10885 [Solirubrobacterales bacterium]|nr:hypothetical protein [Solirubrobacterales bacterium]